MFLQASIFVLERKIGLCLDSLKFVHILPNEPNKAGAGDRQTRRREKKFAIALGGNSGMAMWSDDQGRGAADTIKNISSRGKE
jgi:hypothetical protein